MRIRWTTWLLLLSLTLACAVPVPTLEPLTQVELVDEMQLVGREGAPRAHVRLRLLSEHLTVYPATNIDLLHGRFRYNVAEWSPNIQQDTHKNVRYVTINQGIGSQIPLGASDEYVNMWDVGLAPGIPIDLGIDLGAGDMRLDLGGLSIAELGVTSGNADIVLTFSAPNPEPLGTLRITAGKGHCVATGLGNANFDILSVFGGAGELDLNFNGTQTRSTIANIKAGAGKVTVHVPATVGARVKFSSSPISMLNQSGFTEYTENVYVNAAYGVAVQTLTINLTTGIGTVKLISQ